MTYVNVDVRMARDHRIMDVRPESVRIPLGVRSETDSAKAVEWTRAARAAALGLWTAALCYTREHDLDGFCPLSGIQHLAVEEVIDELVREGLLARAERDGRAGVIVLDPAASRRCE